MLVDATERIRIASGSGSARGWGAGPVVINSLFALRSITATKAVRLSGVNLNDDDRNDNYFRDRAEHKFKTTLDLPNRSFAPPRAPVPQLTGGGWLSLLRESIP